jgi:hypothetical protein
MRYADERISITRKQGSSMKTFNHRSLLLVATLSTMAEGAYSQQPPDVVKSDIDANTAMGTGALFSLNLNGGGFYNTATGYHALYNNTTGSENTAMGLYALSNNITGYGNTASGASALGNNSTGFYNTAAGNFALSGNSIGSFNTAVGTSALESNLTGENNSAFGYGALASNGGSNNTASGYGVLYNNTTGYSNTASGYDALNQNAIGYDNTASGYATLYSNTTGNNNIAEGYEAGYNLTTGSNNIDIGNRGIAGDASTIKIGTQGTHARTYIAGIYNNARVRGLPVVINSQGELGMLFSSERFKTAIAPMGSDTAKLQQLRPVSFRLKSDPRGAVQYGLIAEEVAKVYPELVIRDQKGRIDGVRYDELAPMLLNEMQKKNAAQDEEIRGLKQQVAELNDLKQELHAALLKLRAKDEFVAQR